MSEPSDKELAEFLRSSFLRNPFGRETNGKLDYAAQRLEAREVSEDTIEAFAKTLRQWWSFDDRQFHTHSWHSRETFIEQVLPELIQSALKGGKP